MVDHLNENGFVSTTWDSINYTSMSWANAHKELLEGWRDRGLCEIISTAQFNVSMRTETVYTLNIGNAESYETFNPWSAIPQQARTLLHQYHLPIVILFSLEHFSQINLQEFVAPFAQEFPQSRLVIVTLSTYHDYYGNEIRMAEILNDPNLRNVRFVGSTGFLERGAKATSKLPQNHSAIHSMPLTKSKLLLNLNNWSRDNRNLLTQSLYLANLLDDNIVTMNHPNTLCEQWVANQLRTDTYVIKDVELQIIAKNEMQYQINYERYVDSKSPISKHFIELIKSLRDNNIIKLRSLHNGETPWTFNDIDNFDWYRDTWCSVVTETYCVPVFPNAANFDISNAMLTEKITKPLALRHPFVIAGHGNSHKWMQSLGFKTFEQSWFELPADGTPGNLSILERNFNLIESLTKLSKLTRFQLLAKWVKVLPDLNHNYNHLITTDWGQIQINLIREKLLFDEQV